MKVYIHQIKTATPDTVYEQSFLAKTIAAYYDSTRLKSFIHTTFEHSGIRQRFMCLADFEDPHKALLFKQDFCAAGTAERNCLYQTQADLLYQKVVKKIFADSPVMAADISDLITVSCTGFYAPGADKTIIEAFGLSRTVRRRHLGFMGCSAALPALETAYDICRSRPNATVLVVCLELCSIHLQKHPKLDNLIAASLFGDGAAACIVSARKPQGMAYEIVDFSSKLSESGGSDLTWTIGDQGFEMFLSKYIPDLIQEDLDCQFIEKLSSGRDTDFAVHPGGKKILEKVQSQLELADHQLESSYNILANYGNMSSPTILFVLAEILEKNVHENDVLAMAFGPGLSTEIGVLKKRSF
jgi:predicted naringenin-chalcone synthase